MTRDYHRRELLQVPFLSRQTRHCRDKHVFVTIKQKYACCDKTFVATEMILVVAPANAETRRQSAFPVSTNTHGKRSHTGISLSLKRSCNPCQSSRDYQWKHQNNPGMHWKCQSSQLNTLRKKKKKQRSN